MDGGNDEKWYLRYHGDALGPFPGYQIARYLLLQRLHLDDEVSRDRHKWYTIREVPEVWPEKRLSSPGISDEEKQRLQATRKWVEEHAALFASREEAPVVDALPTFAEEPYHARHKEKRGLNRLAGYALALLLAAAVISVAFLMPRGNTLDYPQCDLPAGPGVNWSNCQLQGSRLENADLSQSLLRNANLQGSVLRAANLASSDLAYANLSQANLRGANLSGATLTGSDLRNSDLQSANFTGADLSYADLRGALITGARFDGARLGNAVLDEQTLCMPESIGRCIPARR